MGRQRASHATQLGELKAQARAISAGARACAWAHKPLRDSHAHASAVCCLLPQARQLHAEALQAAAEGEQRAEAHSPAEKLRADMRALLVPPY